MFAIGLTLLGAVNLEDYEEIYYPDMTLDSHSLEKGLADLVLNTKYS
jgi:hypothetical protein